MSNGTADTQAAAKGKSRASDAFDRSNDLETAPLLGGGPDSDSSTPASSKATVRQARLRHGRGPLVRDDSDDEGDELAFDDVEDDFISDAKGKWNLQNATCTPGYVKRQYAFGIKGVPRKETNWMEVTCDFPGALALSRSRFRLRVSADR